jgi:hypothetical protein
MKKEAEHEDEATIRPKMKSLSLVQIEEVDRQPVARSRTDVHQDWWRVQGLVTTPQFSLD